MGLFSGGSQKTETKPWEGVRPALKNLYSGTMATGMNQLPMAPFTTFAPFTQTQIGGMQGALDYAQGRYDPGVAFQQATLQDMMMSPANVMQNPTLQGMMGANAAQVGDTLQRDWLPQIGSAAVRGGSYGGSRQGIAEGVAMGDAAQALANANAQTLYGAYGDALRQQTAGAQMMPGALQMGFLGPQTAMDVGRMLQSQDQRRIDEMQQRYYYPEQKMRDTLGWQAGIYSGASPYGESKQSGGGGSTFGDVLGLGLTAAGVAGGLGWQPFAAQAASQNPWATSGANTTPFQMGSGRGGFVNLFGG